MIVDPVPPAARIELERLGARWRTLPLPQALGHAPKLRAQAQRYADELSARAAAPDPLAPGAAAPGAAAADGPAPAARPAPLPDLGPATAYDQLVVLTYDLSRVIARDADRVALLVEELAELRRSLTPPAGSCP